MSNFKAVGEFMSTFGQEVKTTPELANKKTREMRIKLIREELKELKEAIADRDLVEIADALTDILYVTYGAGHVYGIDLDACFAEVHRSNMTKLGEDGKPIYRADGKILKGPNYSEPDLAKVIGIPAKHV